VLAHYAIYKMCRALALSLGMNMPEDHEGHLDHVEEQLLRRGLLPTPWDARCDKGRAPRSRAVVPHLFTGMPSGTAPCPNLWAPTPENMWPLVATALKTTRDRSRAFETELDRWRHAHRSKAAKAGRTKRRKRWVPYDVQDALYAAVRPTKVLDFVYRLRRRSSYLDDSSFLSNSIGMRDAIGFNRDLLLFTRSTLHVLEFLGRIIEATPGEQLKPDHCARVQALWERRRGAAAELELADRRPELEAFGWIFVTGRCDPEWMLRELIATLELTGSIEPDSKVMDKLTALAPASPVEAVRAVDLLTESPKERWFVQASLEEIQVILRNGLADKRSREAARRLVNRLYADGQGAGLVQLLDEPSANT